MPATAAVMAAMITSTLITNIKTSSRNIISYGDALSEVTAGWWPRSTARLPTHCRSRPNSTQSMDSLIPCLVPRPHPFYSRESVTVQGLPPNHPRQLESQLQCKQASNSISENALLKLFWASHFTSAQLHRLK